MDEPPAIEAVRLGKAYGRRWALRDVDLRVEPGERVALLGPNGAGKTTLLRILSTLSRPTRGGLRILGRDPARRSREVHRSIGVVGHRPLLYEDLTGRENLEFYALLYGLRDAPARYEPLMRQAGLAHATDGAVRGYSRGMQQRLALVRALLHGPRLLLLDEPDSGLDQDALHFLETVVTGDGSSRAVLFSTHNHELGLRLADRVVVMAGGSIVYDAPAAATDLVHFRDTYSELAGAGA